MAKLMEALGWTVEDFDAATEERAALQAERICRRRIDAAVYMVAHPNLSVLEAMSTCDAILVPVAGSAVDRLVAEDEHFMSSSVPAGVYGADAPAVPGFGVVATVVASAKTSPDVVYEVVKAVFENLEEMKMLLPVFADLDHAFMLAPYHAAPWHPGALRYYREAGLM